MIKLRGKTEAIDPSNKIIFEPRAGFSRGRGVAPELEFPLIYGHRCPTCGNVIQALFKAPRAFSLWPYEETVILSQGEKNAGEIRTVYPDDKTPQGKSCYRIDFSPAGGGSIKLTLSNHIMRMRSVVDTIRGLDGEGIWEKNFERPCIKAGIFSIREDLLIKDFLLFSQLSNHEVSQYNIPPIRTLIPDTDVDFKLAPAIGLAPPVILVERQTLRYGFHYKTKPKLAAYRKQGQ